MYLRVVLVNQRDQKTNKYDCFNVWEEAYRIAERRCSEGGKDFIGVMGGNRFSLATSTAKSVAAVRLRA